ncbi:MAG: hypothetical protein OIF58_12080 [Cohaesibacter sp.]|nr:hypothetical protein [Cohaesibacter sp.]
MRLFFLGPVKGEQTGYGPKGEHGPSSSQKGSACWMTAWVVFHADWVKRGVMFGRHLNGARRVLVRMAR